MSVVFKQRNNDTQVLVPPSVTLTVERYSKAAKGGCKEAIIRASGERRDLYDFLNWLRYKVEIANERSQLRWWGLIARVDVYDENTYAYADIDFMNNRLAVAYTSQVLGQNAVGSRSTTAWVQDDLSIAEFGSKELLDPRGGMGQTRAEYTRDRLLEQTKFPRAVFDTSEGGGEIYAKLTCRGWWYTTEWKYCPVATRLALAFETIGSWAQTIGCDYNDDQYNVTALAQSFMPVSSFNLQEIEIYVYKVGAPGYNLGVAIHDNPDDLEPGTQLASVQIAPASVGASGAWVKATLSSALGMSGGAKYFLNLTTSTVDQDNYYVAVLDENQGYGAGILRQKVGSTWSDGQAADMPFRFYANDVIETTQQIQSLLTSFGQFLRRIRMEVSSGIYEESYRNGDTDARFEVDELLDGGTTSLKRLFAEVDPSRNVRIFEQPGSDEYILLDKEGIFLDRNNTPVAVDACPVGIWVFPSGIVPANVDMSLLLGVQAFLLEEAEYDVETGKLSYTPANVESPWDLGVRSG